MLKPIPRTEVPIGMTNVYQTEA